MLKVYIFNAVLNAGAEAGSTTLMRGYFICRDQKHDDLERLHDALFPFGLRLENIEREHEISDELLFQSLPHIHTQYHLRGYGLELYDVDDKPMRLEVSPTGGSSLRVRFSPEPQAGREESWSRPYRAS